MEGFSALADAIDKRYETPVEFFYPSTVALDDSHRDLLEYRLAKGAGEALCREFSRSRSTVHVVTERLPRLNSDQTASLVKMPTTDAVRLLLDLYIKNYGAVQRSKRGIEVFNGA